MVSTMAASPFGFTTSFGAPARRFIVSQPLIIALDPQYPSVTWRYSGSNTLKIWHARNVIRRVRRRASVVTRLAVK